MPMKGWAMQENSSQMLLRTHIYFGSSDHHIRSWVLIRGGVNLSVTSTLLWQLVLLGNYSVQINPIKALFHVKTKTVSLSTPEQLVEKVKFTYWVTSLTLNKAEKQIHQKLLWRFFFFLLNLAALCTNTKWNTLNASDTSSSLPFKSIAP